MPASTLASVDFGRYALSKSSSFLTQEMRQMALGVESGPAVLEIEKGAIKKFADAIQDPNPLWNDEVQARKTRYGGMIAPPTLLRSVVLERPALPFSVPFNNFLDGGSEWEYYEPIRVGDRITARVYISGISERDGRLGKMLFVMNEFKYTNQFEEMVAIQRTTTIRYKIDT